MGIKTLIITIVLFIPILLGSTSDKTKSSDNCIDCDTKIKDSIIWERSTFYLDSLRGVLAKSVVDKKLKVDSLHKEVLHKDKIITTQSKKINNLSKELSVIKQSIKEEVVEKKDTVVKKTFFQKIGIKK